MCIYKNNFCLSERSIHDSYLCLENISSFLCLYFRLCKKTRGLRANQKHNQNMQFPGQQFIRMVLEPWSQPLLCGLQLREGFGYKGDSSCCSLWLAQGHQIQPDPSALHLLLCFLCKPCPSQGLDHHPQGTKFQLWSLRSLELMLLTPAHCRNCSADPVHDLYFWQTFRYCYLFSSGYQMKYFPFHLAA